MNRQDQLEQEIRTQLAAQQELKDGIDQLAENVKEYWRSVSPVGDGDYAASVKVFKNYILVDGMPGRRVGATDFKAHWIEYGTGDPGPTDAFAPRAKTAAHFGGDESKVDAIVVDENLSAVQRTAQLQRYTNITVDMTGGDEA